jgi:hypothetical protein
MFDPKLVKTKEGWAVKGNTFSVLFNKYSKAVEAYEYMRQLRDKNERSH